MTVAEVRNSPGEDGDSPPAPHLAPFPAVVTGDIGTPPSIVPHSGTDWRETEGNAMLLDVMLSDANYFLDGPRVERHADLTLAPAKGGGVTHRMSFCEMAA